MLKSRGDSGDSNDSWNGMLPTIGDNEDVTAQTMATLNQFWDRHLVGEDIIWTNYDDGSFLWSHRLISAMRRTGDGRYGEARGRLPKPRIIADRWVVDQVVTEQWPPSPAVLEAAAGIGAVAFRLPKHDKPGGHADIDCFYLGYLSALPDAGFTLESAIINRDPCRAVRVALRRQCEVFVDGRVRQEWACIDEVVIWK